jgi:hypothetical protein
VTRKLETLLNLPEYQTEANEIKDKIKQEKTNLQELDIVDQTITDIDTVSASLPIVSGLGHVADKELDDLAEKATKAYEDLMDLGMNVESRYSSRIFEVASTMLKNAIDAKTAKLDKKLKVVELQLRKQRLEHDIATRERKNNSDNDAIDMTEYVVTDRNSLLEKLKKIDK